MKKTTLLFLSALILVATSNVSAETVSSDTCYKAVYFAVNNQDYSSCKKFLNSCEIPDGWRKVPNCGPAHRILKKTSYLNNNWNKRMRALSSRKDKKQDVEKTENARISASSYLKNNLPKIDKNNKRPNTRTFTGGYFRNSRQSVNKVKPTVEKKRGYRISTANSTKRNSNEISNDSRWEEKMKQHYREKNYKKRKVWQSFAEISADKREEIRKKELEEKKELEQELPYYKLNQIWRGKREPGSLEGQIY